MAGVQEEYSERDEPLLGVEVELPGTRFSGYAAVVTLRGEHDLACSGALAAALSRLGGHILVDLAECDFIDSAIIRVILTRWKELGGNGHRVELLLPPENRNLARINSVIGLRDFITIHDRVGVVEALARPLCVVHERVRRPFGELEPDCSLVGVVDGVHHVDRQTALVEAVGDSDVLDLEGRRLERARRDDETR